MCFHRGVGLLNVLIISEEMSISQPIKEVIQGPQEKYYNGMASAVKAYFDKAMF